MLDALKVAMYLFLKRWRWRETVNGVGDDEWMD